MVAPMELRNVRAFLAVADQLHFGRAAAALNVTQPALTQRIQVLERELGIQLLQRNSREVSLTPAGEALLEHARSLAQEEDRALRAMRDHVAGIAGRFRISYISAWNVGLPVAIVGEFRRRYPAVRLETTSGQSRSNIDRLMADDLDFAFVIVPAGGCKGLVVRPINRQEVLVVMTSSNHLAQMERIPIECIRGQPIIAVSSAMKSPHVDAARKWFARRLGEEPNIVAEEPLDQIAAAVAQSGVALAFTIDTRAAAMSATGLICRPMSPALLIDYGVAYLDASQSPCLANMLGLVEDLAPRFSSDLPAGSELVWTAEDLEHAEANR
jgi:DNA-binding transcriptional LysR family regulator